MTDAREPNAPGHDPFDPAPGARGRDGHGVGEAQVVKGELGQGPRPVRRPAERPATAGGGGLVLSAALALLFGGAGAWAYERFLAPSRVESPPEASRPQGADPETQKDLARLDDRLSSLSDQYKQLQSRLESLPKPAPSPDLAPLEAKVARLDGLSQQVEALGKKLDPLPQQLTQYDQRITELDAKLDELRREVTAARERTPASRGREAAARPAQGPSPGEGASPSSEKGESVDSALEAGVSRFRDGRYQEAYTAFRRLLQSHPEDARVWYYAALSYGLATGDWGAETERMVQQGVAREKARTPPKSAIDSAFAGLTKETGKEWLDFYRRRAR
jgi:TolA-binding protein